MPAARLSFLRLRCLCDFIVILIIINLYRTLDSPVKDDTSTVSDISQMYIHVCLRQQSYTHVKHDEFSNTIMQFTTLEITIQ